MTEQPQPEAVVSAPMALLWPLWDVSAPILQGFGENKDVYRRFGQKGHNGLDLGAVMQPVRASHDGIVRYAGNGAGEPLMGNGAGECVLLLAESGDMTGYAHLLKMYVSEGDSVTAGDVIAISGKSGATTGYHLHWEYIPAPLAIKNGYMGRVPPTPYIDPPYEAPHIGPSVGGTHGKA